MRPSKLSKPNSLALIKKELTNESRHASPLYQQFVQNKFEILSKLTETDAAAASPSTSAAVSSENLMDTSDYPVATVNESVVTERPVQEKEPRPPPVTLLGHDNLFQINRELKRILKEDMEVVNTREGLRYYTPTVEDHRQLKAYFDAKSKQYYSFPLRTELPLRVMLKRLPKGTDAGKIKE